jgi:hypothetical protein
MRQSTGREDRIARTMSPWRLAALAFGGLLACDAPAGDPLTPELGRRHTGLAGGDLDRERTGVLAIVSVTPEQVELCTATLITPNLVLTARHCVAGTSADTLQCSNSPAFFREPRDASGFWVNHAEALSGPLVSFGLLPLTGGSDEFVPVAEVHVPDTDVVCGGDIAALILDGLLDAEVSRPLAPRLDEPVATGEAYTAVGFGATPVVSEQGARRSRDGLVIDCGGEDCRGRDNLEPNEFAGGDGVCSGDSGGPAIAADGRLIGVASRSTDCQSSVYSAVSSWRDFIRPIAQQALLLGDYPAPDWLEPSVVVVDPDAGQNPAISDGGISDAPASDDAARDGASGIAPPVPIAAVDDSVAGGGEESGSGCSMHPPQRGRTAASWLLLASCLVPLGVYRRRVRSGRGAALERKP